MSNKLSATIFTTFNQLSPNDRVALVEVNPPKNEVERTYVARLAGLGLIPGIVFTFIRSAPLGDPIEVMVRGASLLLRKQEAAILKLKRLAL